MGIDKDAMGIKRDASDRDRDASDRNQNAISIDRDAIGIDRDALSIALHPWAPALHWHQSRRDKPRPQAQGKNRYRRDGLTSGSSLAHTELLQQGLAASQSLSGFGSCCQTSPEGFTFPNPTLHCPNNHILLKYQELFPYISWRAGHNPKHT